MSKIGRPREPVSQISDWAMWKRHQRSSQAKPGNNWIGHHTDGNKGRTKGGVQVMSRSAHAKVHRKKAIKRQLSR